jgi:hypothetical protein
MGALGRSTVILGDENACALLGLAHDAVFLFFFFTEETHATPTLLRRLDAFRFSLFAFRFAVPRGLAISLILAKSE